MDVNFLSPNRYTSVKQYFTDYFQLRKKEDPNFSFEDWSEELGFKSRSYLRMVCSGDRDVTPKLVNIFSESNKLNELQTTHLTLISLYDKAETASEKKIYLDKIFESLETTADAVEIKDYVHFLSNLQLPTIQLVTSFEDSPKTAEELSDILDVDVQTLNQNLNQLKQMGLVSELIQNGSSLWTATSKAFKVSDKNMDGALQFYYEQTLVEARNHLLSNEEMKRFRSVFFMLNDENYLEFKEEAEAFLLKMRHKFASSQMKDGRLFKVNLFAYPVTKKINQK